MKQRLTILFLLMSSLAVLTYWRGERSAGAAATANCMACTVCPSGNIMYVDANVVGGANNGTSWENAYASLAAALAATNSCTSVTEVWVAHGTYKPDTTGLADARTATFTLKNNLKIYGGFTSGQVNLNQRDPKPATNGTVLSGNLDNGENSYHVVTGGGTNNTAILDGFTISGGWANGAEPNNRGGGMYNENSRPTLINLNFSSNRGLDGGGMYNIFSDTALANISFIGNSASNYGGGMYNNNSRPKLTNATFIGNSASNRGGGMYNENFGSPTLINVSFSGNSAAAGGGIFNNNQCYPAIRNSILWGDSGGEIVNDFSNPNVSSSTVQGGYPGSFDVDPQFISPNNLRLQATSPVINAGAPDILLPATDLDGNPRVSNGVVDLGAYEFMCPAFPTVTLYVNAAVSGGLGDGSSWANAYPTLTAALQRAPTPGCNNITQIWVARGKYTPTDGPSASFGLRNGLAIYGGFNGTETQLSQRNPNPATNGTVLSGDRNNDDIPGDFFTNTEDNCYTIVQNYGVNDTAILDGFTITDNGGSPSQPDLLARICGMFNVDSSPTLRNLIFSGNVGSFGGAMSNFNSNPTLINVTFSDNSGINAGGIFNEGSSPTLTNVTFSGNIRMDDASAGGMYSVFSSPTLTNVIFSGNEGIGMFNIDSSPTLSHVTFSGNQGSGIKNRNSQTTLTNCILWGNGGGEIDNDSVITVSHSIVQGGYPGPGNLASDPQFLASVPPAPSTGGDLRPGPGSPAINAGNNCVLTANGCGNNQPAVTTDLRGLPRPVGGTVDMGAYEVNYALAASSGSGQSTLVNTAFPAPLVATLTEAGQPLTISGIVISFTALPANNGASASFSSANPTTTNSNAQASVNVQANLFPGSYTVNASLQNLLASFSLSNSCPALVLSPSSLSSGTVGTNYAQTLSVSGAFAGSAAFSISGGSLPPGLTLGANGALSGVPTTAGSFTFTVKATDTLGCFGTQSYTVSIACAPLVISPASLSNAQAGVAFTQNLSATGSGTRSFSLSASPAPPLWLTLTAGGVLSGTPPAPGSFSFVVNVADAQGCTGTQAYTLTVGCPTFSLAGLPQATAGSPYNAQLTATPTGGSYQFSSNDKPIWLSLSSAGALNGTPPGAGTFTFNVSVTGFGNCTQTRAVTLTVSCPALSLTPTSLPNANLGAAYSQTVTASPAGTTYTYLVTTNTLPPGLTLNPATGLLSGTPTAAGNYTFVITATGWVNGAASCSAARSYNLLVTATCPALTLSPGSLAASAVGAPYSQNFTASGGTAPYSFAITAGTLPPGLTLASNGALSGTPTTAGTYNFTVTATGSGGCSGSQTYTLTLTCPTITLTPVSLPSATAGVAYNQTVTASPAGNYLYSLATGNLPPGLSLNAATGALTGTATTTGSYAFSLKAERGVGCSAVKAYTLVVNCPTVAVNPASLPNGSVGTAYNQTLSATPSSNYSLTVSAGNLPGGLSLSTAGVLSGTPTASGTFNFTVKATGFGSCFGTRSYTVTIGAACPTVTLPSLPQAVRGVSYVGDLSGTTPSGSYTFSLVSGGTLPPGLALDNLFGALTGTPTTAGTFNFTLQATSAAGCTGTRSYNFVVSGGAAARAELADYDGDGVSDPALWSVADGGWRIQLSGGSTASTTVWGSAGDVTLLGDYDGDGKTDLAVFRPANATWYVKRSSDGQALVKAWGLSTDVPVAGDYDGDGRTDLAVWRGQTGEWLIQRSSDGQPVTQAWGSSAAAYQDVPVASDYDGDGRTDLAVFRRTTGTWLIKRSADGQFFVKAWGLGTDTPVAADYDGDGRTDLAVWRGSVWYIWQSATNSTRTLEWGVQAAPYYDQALPGDYDGDGMADPAAWRASANSWYLQCSQAGLRVRTAAGQVGDRPVGGR